MTGYCPKPTLHRLHYTFRYGFGLTGRDIINTGNKLMHYSKNLRRRISTRTSALFIAVLLGGCGLVPGSASRDNVVTSVFVKPTTWQAMSRTAEAITGDVTLSDTKLTFANGDSIGLALLEHDAQAGQTLYRVTPPTNPELLNGNRLCGNKPVDYLVVQAKGNPPGQSDMQLMAYYYPERLKLADLPLKDKDDIKRMMCALYTYVATPAN